MEISDHAPAVEKMCATATASAEPSSGSVAEPSSSSSTSERCIGQSREPVEVDDVRRERRQLGLDRLRVADVGEKRGEDGKAGCGRPGRAIPACAIMASSADGLERDGLAAGVGAADDELAGVAVVSSRVSGTTRSVPVARRSLFEQRMAGGLQVQPVGCKAGATQS